jgi:hypothetical protein
LVPAAHAAPGNSAASVVTHTLRVEKETHEALRNGTLDAKQRRGLAFTAIARYLTDYLKGLEVPESKVKPFVQAVTKDFTKFAPAWRVEAGPEPEARVTLTLATGLIVAELEKQGLRPRATNAATNSATNATAGGEAGSQGNTTANPARRAAQVAPYAALLVDEKNKEIYVTPPEAVLSYAIDGAAEDQGYRFKPAAALKAVAPGDVEVNSVVSPLSQRAAVFSNKFLFHLQNKNLVFKPDWAKQILGFLETSARVGRERGESRAWPPVLPLSLSTLSANPGLLAVFTVRSDDKAGVLERVDVVGLVGGRMLRHYWSRAMHDPGFQETAGKAIEKAASGFSRLHRVKRPDAPAGNLGFWVDRRVSDRDVVAVESVLRGFALGEDTLLVPTEITKEDVRYVSAVPGGRAEMVLEKIRRSVPGVVSKLATGEPPVIVLSPQAVPSAQPR